MVILEQLRGVYTDVVENMLTDQLIINIYLDLTIHCAAGEVVFSYVNCPLCWYMAV